MAGTLQFDLVSPERRLASVVASEVQIPGADGDLTAMEGHAPTITTLRPGILRAVGASGTQAYAVTGGFAEITASGVSVLAERAIPVAEATAAMMDELVAEARAAAATAQPDDRDTAEKLVNDVLAMRAAAGPLFGCTEALKDLGVIQGAGPAEQDAAMARWSTACSRWGKIARLSMPMQEKGRFAAAAALSASVANT